MPAVATRRGLTAEEFWEQYAGKPYELVRGRLDRGCQRDWFMGLSRCVWGGGWTRRRLRADTGLLWLLKQAFGCALREASRCARCGVHPRRTPATPPAQNLRRPRPRPRGGNQLPSDSYSELRDKVDEWLQAGVQVVWVVDPQRRVVEVFQPDQPLRVLREGDTLTAEPLLPGFTINISELFADLAEE